MTEKRCRECLEHGTDYLWFCTVAHKKLVSYSLHLHHSRAATDFAIFLQIFGLHKRVCGIRGAPFQWPGFSAKEVSATIAGAIPSEKGGTVEGARETSRVSLTVSSVTSRSLIC